MGKQDELARFLHQVEVAGLDIREGCVVPQGVFSKSMRFAKIFRFGGRRADVGVDLNNLLNTNYATAYETQYAYGVANGSTWFNPTTILAPRFARLNFTLNF